MVRQFLANGKCTMDYKQLSENERYQNYMLNKAGHNRVWWAESPPYGAAVCFTGWALPTGFPVLCICLVGGAHPTLEMQGVVCGWVLCGLVYEVQVVDGVCR